MNAMMVIHPYKVEGIWVFDDPKVGLDKEPFVSGADDLIDRFVVDIPDAQLGFNLLFSAQLFPGFEAELEYVRCEDGGNWYHNRKFDMEGWLCPALFKYFSDTPKRLYAQFKGRG